MIWVGIDVSSTSPTVSSIGSPCHTGGLKKDPRGFHRSTRSLHLLRKAGKRQALPCWKLLKNRFVEVCFVLVVLVGGICLSTNLG